MKVGLFFGSFNPIHIGHLILANHMAENTDLDQVWFIVSPQNPFKKNNNLLHEFDRLTMVNLAIAESYKLKASDIEFHMPKPSYTVDTLAYISNQHPDISFKLIIGEDNLEQFTRWKNYQVILDLYELYVYPRPNAGKPDISNHPSIKFVDQAPLLDISATYIREMLKGGKSIKFLTPEVVENYIQRNNFYQS